MVLFSRHVSQKGPVEITRKEKAISPIELRGSPTNKLLTKDWFDTTRCRRRNS